MTFWTVLWLTAIGGPLAGVEFAIPYKSEADCNTARVPVSETLHYDHKIECVVSDVASGSPHPLPRPTSK